MRPKPTIVGTDNPHWDAVLALSPRIPNTAGFRLWKMMNDWCGISTAEYERSFFRTNVEDAPFTFSRGSTVVVLGEEVRQYFGLKKVFLHPQVAGNDVAFRYVPHPSGRCHYYNNKLCRDLVAMMLEDLIR